MISLQSDISHALDTLRSGGIILYPTDTIWGLGCDATNAEAVKKIYELKNRADNKSMIVLVDSLSRIYSYIDDVPDIALDIIELTTKPLTVILEGAKNIAENVINKSDKSIGIRVVKDSFCEQLIRQFKKPIVSTSANISETPAPSIYSEINDAIISNVDYVVFHRRNDTIKSAPSSIIKVGKNGAIKVIRT